MEYCSFLEHVREAVQERRGGNSRVWIAPVLKNNRNCMDMLTILDGEANAAPAICLEPYYQRYLAGDTIEKISEEILQFHSAHRREEPYDLSFYRDYERVRKRIVCRLVNYGTNLEMLQRVPYRRFLDLAVVYYYMLEDDTFGRADILVRQEHLQMWNADLEELDDAAVSNTARLLPYECLSVADMLRESAGIVTAQEEAGMLPMYVLTNTARNYGAVVITYGAILDALAERLGGDFYVLPSSIHECMLVPGVDYIDPKALRQMVCEINEEYVEPEEVLGDSVYRYSAGKKQLLLVEPEERRDTLQNSTKCMFSVYRQERE